MTDDRERAEFAESLLCAAAWDHALEVEAAFDADEWAPCDLRHGSCVFCKADEAYDDANEKSPHHWPPVGWKGPEQSRNSLPPLA